MSNIYFLCRLKHFCYIFKCYKIYNKTLVSMIFLNSRKSKQSPTLTPIYTKKTPLTIYYMYIKKHFCYIFKCYKYISKTLDLMIVFEFKKEQTKPNIYPHTPKKHPLQFIIAKHNRVVMIYLNSRKSTQSRIVHPPTHTQKNAPYNSHSLNIPTQIS